MAGLYGGRGGDIMDEGWLKSMKELEWRRKNGLSLQFCGNHIINGWKCRHLEKEMRL